MVQSTERLVLGFSSGHNLRFGCLFVFLIFYLFIHEGGGGETQAEGEAGSIWGPQRGT